MLTAAFLTLIGVAVHWSLVQVLASAWIAPDLTLVAVVWVSARYPSQAWIAGLLAGILTMGWMPEAGLLSVIAYSCVVALVRWLSGVWNMADWRGQALVVGLCEAVWIALQLWIHGGWRPSALYFGLLHLAVTLLALRVIVRLGDLRPARLP